uniref:BPL/LPL catalytic domain-containing protein n=1 Tax=Meloidogyne hapla TaxID=6305 RepID=A0A1I8BQP9_MELHA
MYFKSGVQEFISNISINRFHKIKRIFKRLGMDNNDKIKNNSTLPKFTVGYMFANPDIAISSIKLMDFGKEFGTNPKLIFQPSTLIDKIWEQQVKENLLPIEIRRQKEGIPKTSPCNFEINRFYERLETKVFGRFIIFVPVCASTMNISDRRSGNEWISPIGAALFTINLIVPFDSSISKSLVLIQHLTAVSICKAISEFIPNFPIRIKWPNDLYYKREFKLGGILVSSSQSENGYNCSIGVGLNIANSKPTICINDLINKEMDKLETEDVIATILNKFEDQLETLKSKGCTDLIRDYEKFWLHTNENVSISLASNSGIEEKVTIKGIDENGYLLVLKESGEYESVMDNGL